MFIFFGEMNSRSRYIDCYEFPLFFVWLLYPFVGWVIRAFTLLERQAS